MLDEQAWTEYINQDDPVIGTAIRVMRNNAAFPKAPSKTYAKDGKVALNDTRIFDNRIRFVSHSYFQA